MRKSRRGAEKEKGRKCEVKRERVEEGERKDGRGRRREKKGRKREWEMKKLFMVAKLFPRKPVGTQNFY